MAKHRKLHFYTLLGLIPLVLFFIGLVGLSSYVALQYRADIDMHIKGDWPIEGDSLIGFVTAKQALTTRIHTKKDLTFNVFTDARGIRVNADSKQTPDKVNILTIGGSFSWGYGMENEETYTEILRHKLNVSVANLSFGSYGTVQSLQLLQRNSDLQPKIIVYGFINDHLRRNLSPCAPSLAPFCLPVAYIDFGANGTPYIHGPRMEYSSEAGRRSFEIITSGEFGVKNVLWGAKAIFSNLKNRFVFNYADSKELRQEGMLYLMSKMTLEAKRLGALLVVVYIPELERVYTSPPPSELIDALNPDILFIDMSRTVTRYYEDERNPSLRFERDSHPNHLAHELIADEILNALENRAVY